MNVVKLAKEDTSKQGRSHKIQESRKTCFSLASFMGVQLVYLHRLLSQKALCLV